MGPDPSDQPKALITLRSAQVRRISWVRGVRPVRERCEWPPQEAAPDRPPYLRPHRALKLAYPRNYALYAKQKATPFSRLGRNHGVSIFVLKSRRAAGSLDLGFAELDVLAG